MSNIKRTMFLTKDASNYRMQMGKRSYEANINSPEKTPDPNQQLTQMVEDRARDGIQTYFQKTKFRVISWEELDIYNRYIVKFLELDDVLVANGNTTVIVEIKASSSKSCVRSGLKQLKKSLKIACCINPNTIGILAIASLGEEFSDFANQSESELVECFNGKNIPILDWPPRLPSKTESSLFATLINSTVLNEWLSMYSDEKINSTMH